MEPISSKYRDLIVHMMQNSQGKTVVNEKNVYQKANPLNRPYIDKMVEELLLPGSRIMNMENLFELYEHAKAGKSCLILMEHFSNFDIPNLYYLLEHSGEKGREVADSIVSIAGMKLNEESSVVLAFTEAYTRIVIYPSRSMKSIDDPEKFAEEKRKNNAINRAAMHELVRAKNSGHLVLVFPAGTRYRPWEPSTGKGLKEIDSYVKSFDYMSGVGICGNILRINPNQTMQEDLVANDVVIYNIGPVTDCKAFREKYRAETPPEEDPKQFVVDNIMNELSRLHEEAESIRQAQLQETP